MKVLLDTNILLRNAVPDDPQHAEVYAALQRLVSNGSEPCICTQNLVEFWVVATRPIQVNGLGLTPAIAEQEARVMIADYAVLRDTPDLLERWLDLCTRYGVSGRQAHDARLVAAMLSHSITHMLSLNATDFIRYPEITVVSPADV